MSDYQDLPYHVQDMQLDDIDEVMAIERRSFAAPWSVRAYQYELTTNSFSQFIVVRQAMPSAGAQAEYRPNFMDKLLGVSPRRPSSPILGYAGLWLLIDEAHISTIAVVPEWRGRGLGELLLVNLLDRSVGIGADVATLEVRASNLVAQNLYRKYQFRVAGLRKGYYSDNSEDALVMTTAPLRSYEFRQTLLQNKIKLAESLRKGGRRLPSDQTCPQMG
jgi:[ribosomal protein S18]-alanine N-acetyltransferase